MLWINTDSLGERFFGWRLWERALPYSQVVEDNRPVRQRRLRFNRLHRPVERSDR